MLYGVILFYDILCCVTFRGSRPPVDSACRLILTLSHLYLYLSLVFDHLSGARSFAIDCLLSVVIGTLDLYGPFVSLVKL
jgi:hypothetical protein